MRINSQGQYDQKKGIWRPSGSTTGVADIHAISKGVHYSIEVKAGKDRQSDAQKSVQALVEKAGGVYIVVQSFDDFMTKLLNISQKLW